MLAITIPAETQQYIINNLKPVIGRTPYSPDDVAGSLVNTYRAGSLDQAQQMVAEVIAQQAPTVEPTQQTPVIIDTSHDKTALTAAEGGIPFDGALHVAAKGVPQIPLRPRTKIAFQNNWPELATTDPAQLNAWAVQYPDCNWASVAQAKPGGVWVFEIDDKGAVQSLGAPKLPKTFMVRSRPGRGHFYFRHNAASLELAASKAYISIKTDQGKEACSARFDHAYAVTAKSVHPETGQPYEIVSDVDLIEAPQELIEWIRQHHVEKKLPVTASSDGPRVPRGSHDNELIRIAGLLRQKGLEEDEIYPVLVRNVEERFDEYGPDYLDMCRAKAQSICRYAKGDSSIQVLHNGVPVGLVEPDARQKQAAQAVVIETEPIVTKESLPEFPKMSGVLCDMAIAMFPDIPHEFKFMALATHWGLVRSGLDVLDGEPHYQPRFFTCFIADPGRGKSAAINEVRRLMEAIRPPTMGIADSVDSGPALVDDFADLQKQHPSAKAVQVLIEADEMTDLFEKSKITAQSRNSLSTMLLSLFERTIASNRARSANKGKRTQVENAHLAVLGGTTFLGAETMWNKIGGGANGLQSRFVPIVTTQGALGRATRTPSHADALNKALMRLLTLNGLPGQTVCLDMEAQQELNDWWAKYTPWDKASVRRMDDLVKRMIIVLAVTNIDPDDREPIDENCVIVGRDIVVQATTFGDYVIAVREKVNPADSYSWTQAFESSIQAVFEKSPEKMFSKRDVRRAVNADHKPGGYQSFGQAWDIIVKPDLGIVDLIGNNHKGAPVYRLVAD